MTRLTRPLGALAALALLALVAAHPAPAQDTTPTRIAIVNIDEIIARSSSIGEAVRRAEGTLRERQQQVDEKMEALRQSREDLARRRSVLGEEQIRAEEEKQLRLREEIQDLQHETNKELSRIQQQAMPPEVDRIMVAVREVALREGYDMVLTAEFVLFHSERVDLTPLVVQHLDRRASQAPAAAPEKKLSAARPARQPAR